MRDASHDVLDMSIKRDPAGASACQEIIDQEAARFWSTWSNKHKLPSGWLFYLLKRAYDSGFVSGMRKGAGL